MLRAGARQPPAQAPAPAGAASGVPPGACPGGTARIPPRTPARRSAAPMGDPGVLRSPRSNPSADTCPLSDTPAGSSAGSQAPLKIPVLFFLFPSFCFVAWLQYFSLSAYPKPLPTKRIRKWFLLVNTGMLAKRPAFRHGGKPSKSAAISAPRKLLRGGRIALILQVFPMVL